MKPPSTPTASVALRTPLLRGARRVGIALVGLPDAGRSTLFTAVSSPTVDSARLAYEQERINEKRLALLLRFQMGMTVGE